MGAYEESAQRLAASSLKIVEKYLSGDLTEEKRAELQGYALELKELKDEPFLTGKQIYRIIFLGRTIYSMPRP